LGGSLHRREFRAGKKGGLGVGKTKRGKGTKWMVVVDGEGIPLGSHLTSASPAEVTLVAPVIERLLLPYRPWRLVADRAYDSDPLRRWLAAQHMELVCPHRRGRQRPPTQDARPLRRYRRRWKIERTFAWLGNFRRLLVRHEHHLHIYRAFFHLACLLIVLRHL
jgi:transposase